jgi:hypothetical protein
MCIRKETDMPHPFADGTRGGHGSAVDVGARRQANRSGRLVGRPSKRRIGVAKLPVELGTGQVHGAKLGIEAVQSADDGIHVQQTCGQEIVIGTRKTRRQKARGDIRRVRRRVGALR